MLASQPGQSFKESFQILFNPWLNCRLFDGNFSRIVQCAIQISNHLLSAPYKAQTKQFSMILRSFCCLLKPAEQFICVKLFPKIPSYPEKSLQVVKKVKTVLTPNIFTFQLFRGKVFLGPFFFEKWSKTREFEKKNFFGVLF